CESKLGFVAALASPCPSTTETLPLSAFHLCASRNQLEMPLFPSSSVHTDSGWYWTPQKGFVLCLTAIRLLSFPPSSLSSSTQASGTRSGHLPNALHLAASHPPSPTSPCPTSPHKL